MARKILYKYSIGTSGRIPVLGGEKKQVLQWISLQRQSHNITDGQKFISCVQLGTIYSKRDTGQLREPRKQHQGNKKKKTLGKNFRFGFT